MSTIDYKSIGLKAGLEVHQQLDTRKLFCRCPSKLMTSKPDFTFSRILNLSASELGEYDRAAAEQSKKGLVYEYEFYNECCCLVECDEEPPGEINQEALEIALKVALLCNSRIFDVISVMRKIVLDGSNVSGFQRTALIATGGFIDLEKKKVSLQTIVLEEDAARPVRKEPGKIVYSLDRLGIPLIEIATKPELESPREVKECALKIGELVRRTCKTKRGLGTIRQDINISIKNGARVELKGVQELELIDKYVEREVQRQLSLLKIKEELRSRGLKKEDITNSYSILDNIFKTTNCKIVSEALKIGNHVFGMKLKGFSGILGLELQPGRRFGTELADYIKTRHGIGGLFHSDELPKYGITQDEVCKIKSELNVSEKDSFVIIVSDDEKAKNAFETIADRCVQAMCCIPEETRDALPDGNSCYSRPLPGAARMYPETDVPKIFISKAYIDSLKSNLPLTVAERLKLYKKIGLSEKLAEEMKLSNQACLFEKLLNLGFDGKRCAVLLLEDLKKIERDGFETENLNEEDIIAVIKAESKGIDRQSSIEALKQKIKNPEKSIQNILESFTKTSVTEEEIRKIVKQIIKNNSALISSKKEHAINALMGDSMQMLKGRADSKRVFFILKEELKNALKSIK
ncbi:MAG: Glu-tRNA(Gln) amidotransferase subunit GatE [Candidatus Diapherotrites archaeon]